MKNLIPALLLVLLVACNKESVTKPGNGGQTAIANTAVAYKDNSISVVDFKAKSNSTTIEVTFTTLYEKNVVALEVLKGMTTNNLCSIYKQEVNKDSYSAIKYSTNDLNSYETDAIYYMVKYTLANGDWGYTPVFKLSL
jgi:hypothetical protein